MTALLAVLRLSWPYLACLGVGLGTGGYLVENHWEAKYEALQTAHAQELSDAQGKAKQAIQVQLEQFQAISANNAKVIRDLQTQTDQAAADSARARDLVQRLLHAAAQGTPGTGPMPQASHQPATAQAGQSQGIERLGNLLIDTADESRACARQLNALILEISPQL